MLFEKVGGFGGRAVYGRRGDGRGKGETHNYVRASQKDLGAECALAGKVRRETHRWGVRDPKPDVFVPVAKMVLEEMAVSEPSLKIRLSPSYAGPSSTSLRLISGCDFLLPLSASG